MFDCKSILARDYWCLGFLGNWRDRFATWERQQSAGDQWNLHPWPRRPSSPPPPPWTSPPPSFSPCPPSPQYPQPSQLYNENPTDTYVAGPPRQKWKRSHRADQSSPLEWGGQQLPEVLNFAFQHCVCGKREQESLVGFLFLHLMQGSP